MGQFIAEYPGSEAVRNNLHVATKVWGLGISVSTAKRATDPLPLSLLVPVCCLPMADLPGQHCVGLSGLLEAPRCGPTEPGPTALERGKLRWVGLVGRPRSFLH